MTQKNQKFFKHQKNYTKSFNKSTNQPFKKSYNQPFKKPYNQPFKKPYNQSFKKPYYKSYNQPSDKSYNQPSDKSLYSKLYNKPYNKYKNRYKKYSKIKFNFPKHIIYVHSTFNNTIIIIRDLKGNILSSASAGGSGFRSTKKKTPFAAQMAVEKALKIISRKKIERRVMVFMSGQTFTRKLAYKKLAKSDIKILMLKDVTPIPYNGCRPPRFRRL